MPKKQRKTSHRQFKLFNGLITFMVFFVLSVLLSSSTHAITPTLSLELSGNSIAMDIVALENTGTFASSNNLSISASTNNYSGYTLSISSSTNNASLTGPLNAVSGTNEVLNSIGTISGVTSSGISQNDYSSSSNTQYNDTWGYKPSKINSVSNTNFLPAPSTSGDIIEATSAANANNVANDYTVSIGARVTPATEIGAYSNTFVVTIVANGTPYTITYGSNAGTDTVSNMPSNVTNGMAFADTIDLGSTIPTRAGYTFAGWCTSNSAQTSCSSTIYNSTNNNLADFPIDRTFHDNNIYVYAIWTPTQYTCTKRYRLQNANGTWGSYTNDSTVQLDYGATCNYSKSVTDYKSTYNGTNDTQASTSCIITADGCTASLDFYRNTYTLTVSRNTSYISSASATTSAVHGSNYYRWGQAVSITASASSGNEFTSWTQSGITGSFANANSSSTTFTMGKGNATVTAGGKSSKLYMWNATSANCGQTMYDNRDGTERAYTTARIGSLCWMTKNLMLGKSTTTALTNSTSNVSSSGYTLPASSTSGFSSATAENIYNAGERGCYSGVACYGYYTFAAATAGTNPSSGNASYDICPKGWRLPTESEFQTLKNTYTTGATLEGSPWLGVYGGYYGNSQLFYGEQLGYYWSSTASTSGKAYILAFRYDLADTDVVFKDYGHSIRCVAKS